jgi:hypothetical protein
MLNAKFSGRINFLGTDKAWWLIANENGHINLRPIFEKKFMELRREKVVFSAKTESLALMKNRQSEVLFDCYKIGGNIIPGLINLKKVGTMSIMTHIRDVLGEINGRKVNFEANEEGISLSADSSEKILRFSRVSESVCKSIYKIPEGKEIEICKLHGGRERCIFLGFRDRINLCSKFVSWGRTVLEHYANGRIDGRIGSCGLSK